MVSNQHTFELTGFQRDLLYVIAGQYKPSGQAIRRELAEWIDVGHGQLYTNLDILADKSLIEKGAKISEPTTMRSPMRDSPYSAVVESGKTRISQRS